MNIIIEEIVSEFPVVITEEVVQIKISDATSYFDLIEVADTNFEGKDGFVPTVNEATGKIELQEPASAPGGGIPEAPNNINVYVRGALSWIVGYSKTAIDNLLGAKVNNTRTINSKALSSDITLNADDIAETSTRFWLTDVLKSNYDGAVSWISTNGNNLLNHLTNTSNPHNTTASQVGAYTKSESDSLIKENIVKTIAKNADGQFSFPHGTLQIGNKFYIGTREGATSKLLRYNELVLEESITIPCTSTIGLESLCTDGTRLYGIRHNGGVSYIFDCALNNFTDIQYNAISGVDLLGSPAIVTDGTYIYGVENTTPTCDFFKIRISDWTTISTNTWTGVGGGHWGKINIADGVAYFTSQNGYYAKVSLSDLSYIQMDLREDLSIITDDNDFCPAGNNSAFVNYTIVGGEYRDETTGKGGVLIDNDNWTKLPFNLLPTYCLKFNNDYSKLYSCSNVGYIEEFDFESLIFNLQYGQQYIRNTYTFRQGGVPNEIFFNTSNEPFCTNWISGGNLFKIELTPKILPLITERESYYRNLGGDTSKLSFITITQPVNLDNIETRVNELDAAVILKGIWGAASGSFPASTQAGWSYLVTSDGTIDGIEFKTGDRLISVLDNASTTTYAGNWYKADYTDRINTVCGRTGNVTITSSDLSDFNSAVNALITTALAAFKTANYLDFTSSGQTQLDAKQNKMSWISSSSPYTGTSSTALQKLSNAGSSGNGSFQAKANTRYKIEVQFQLSGLSSTTNSVQFGILGSAGITSVNGQSIACKSATLISSNTPSHTAINTATISAALMTTGVQAFARATINIEVVTSTAGTLIMAFATNVSTTPVVENHIIRFIELGPSSSTSSSDIV